MIGTRGRARDGMLLGAIVTVTHNTFSVIPPVRVAQCFKKSGGYYAPIVSSRMNPVGKIRINVIIRSYISILIHAHIFPPRLITKCATQNKIDKNIQKSYDLIITLIQKKKSG
ncbi:MAG: hypothetical protein D3914_08100 [Candidatus Electrothrix sp. LOE2]|nr:hypothetical protein [Candidatus Electrothrix sp. LOE2]